MFESAVFVVAEGDDRVRSFLAGQLSADGAEVLVADDRRQALARCSARCPDVLLLGTLDGPAAAMELLREIRAGDGLHGQPHPGLPVLVVLEDDAELAVLRAFDAGADDVTSRAVGYAIVRARLRTQMGRERVRGGAPVSRVGELQVDRARRRVTVRREPVDVSAKEFALLCALIVEPTRVFTKDELLRGVWGFRSPGRTRTLDSHACRLRAKLAAAGAGGMVVNVWGVGYRLIDTVDVKVGLAA